MRKPGILTTDEKVLVSRILKRLTRVGIAGMYRSFNRRGKLAMSRQHSRNLEPLRTFEGNFMVNLFLYEKQSPNALSPVTEETL
jgi:hypothetical protein